MNQTLEKIKVIGIVPVVKISNTEDALPLAQALCNGGLPCAEITFRTSAAAESIRRIKAGFPEMIVGAGTVLTPEQVDEALDAGAEFIVSPGLNSKVVGHCRDRGTVIIPGCSNPSDVEQALEFGLNVVKFFPAEAAGGLKMIQALSAPYNNIAFMPTGGITPENISAYLANSHVLACGGSWMVKESLIETGRFNEIESLTKNAVETMLNFHLKQIAVSIESGTEAQETADTLCKMFGCTKIENKNSVIVGNMEQLDAAESGILGCLTVETNSLPRAVEYLKRKGFDVDEKSSNLQTVTLKKRIAGFNLRLLQK